MYHIAIIKKKYLTMICSMSKVHYISITEITFTSTIWFLETITYKILN